MTGISTLPGLTCRFENDSPSVSSGLLAVISHGHDSEAPFLRTGRPALRVSVPVAGTPGAVEVWGTGREVMAGRRGDLVYSHDGRYLFCGGRVHHDENYAVATEALYLQALALIEHMGYPTVARMWNVVGGITKPVEAGTDRYSEFCQARARAFRQRGLTTADMPAATGIGGHDDHTVVYLLATTSRNIVRIENPRQVPAYDYPDQYGAQAPSFARAALIRSPGGVGDLFISGTASIVGHQTVHHDDVEMQTRTTLDNIAALVSAENLRGQGIDARVSLRDLDCVKVYVKHQHDLEAVRRICASALGQDCQVVYAITDVCRDDLLVEIEGFVSVHDR